MRLSREAKGVLVLVGIFVGCWAAFLGFLALVIWGGASLWNLMFGQ